MAINKLDEGTVISFDIKTIIALVVFLISSVSGGIWWYVAFIDDINSRFYQLEKQVELAKKLPVPGTGLYDVDKSDPNAKETWPPRKTEFDMKDEMTRMTLQQAIDDIEEIKKKIESLRRN